MGPIPSYRPVFVLPLLLSLGKSDPHPRFLSLGLPGLAATEYPDRDVGACVGEYGRRRDDGGDDFKGVRSLGNSGFWRYF